MEPLIRTYLMNKVKICDAVESMAEPKEEIVVVIGMLDKFRGDGENYDEQQMDELFARAKRVDLEISSSTNIKVLFLIQLSLALNQRMFVANENRFKFIEQASRILDQAVELISEEIHSSLAAHALAVSAFSKMITSQYGKAVELFEQSQKLNFLKWPRDTYALIYMIHFYATEGRLLEVQAEVKRVEEADKDGMFAEPIANFKFIDAAERGSLDEAAEYFELLSGKTRLIEFNQQSLIATYLMRNLWDYKDWEGVTLPEDHFIWVKVYKALKNNLPEKALEIAREVLVDRSVMHSPYPFIILAELSCGHIEASQMHMKKYELARGPHYLDDFFLMRLELLKGHEEKAVFHYQSLLLSAQKNNAMAALDFFLDLSTELSPSVIRRLSSQSSLMKKVRVIEEVKEIKEEVEVKNLLGNSQAIKTIRKEIKKFGPLDFPVLITGETGSGKEIVAREIHSQSKASKNEFLPINCAAISDSLLQSELFGHCAGAFTGAGKMKIGIFEKAGEGTVFLDEFGDISPLLQVALLRVLEEKEVRAVGSTVSKKIKCRILIATNANLEKLVDEEKFRVDLFYRIKGLEIRIPSLRERPSDIKVLAKYFLSQNRSIQQEITISSPLEELLNSYDWPGNVRELKSKMELMRILNSEKSEYGAEDFSVVMASKGRVSNGNKKNVKRKSATDEDQLRLNEMRSVKKLNESRLDRMRELFKSFEKINRFEMAKLFKVSTKTITSDLKKLLKDGTIEKIEPTKSPRTHFFILKK